MRGISGKVGDPQVSRSKGEGESARSQGEAQELAGGHGKRRVGRSYRPTVEAMEALRLLSGATAALPGLVAAHNLLAEPVPTAIPPVEFPSVSNATWDAA